MEGTAVVKGCGVLILAASELEVEVTGSRPSWGLKELKFSCMLATNKMPGQGGGTGALCDSSGSQHPTIFLMLE